MREGLQFHFVDSDSLTEKQIEDAYNLNLQMYPNFAEYYHRNKYYSSVKPQMFLLIYHGYHLVADGKFLWRQVPLEKSTINFFGFGMLVRTDYQRQGIGSEMVRLFKDKAKELNGDLLYGSTESTEVVNMLGNLGFKEISARISYQNGLTDKVEECKYSAFGYDLKEGVVDLINRQGKLFIGTGPV